MTSRAVPFPQPGKLSPAEIRKRVKALADGAAAMGLEVGAIRMNAAGDIELVDKSLVPANDTGNGLDDFL